MRKAINFAVVLVIFLIVSSYAQEELYDQTDDKGSSYTTKALGGESVVNTLRKFRDEILGSSDDGKEYIRLFWQLLPDAVLTMIRDSHVRTRTAEAATQIVSYILSALENKHIPSEIGQISDSLLDDYVNSKMASEDLRNNILRMKAENPLMDFISRYNNGAYPTVPSGTAVKHHTPHNQKYSPEYILVKFKSHTTLSMKYEICNEVGATIEKHYKGIDVYKVKVPYNNVMETIDRLSKYDEVKYAEPDYTLRIFQVIPNDPDFEKLWGLHNTGQEDGTADADIDAPEAWGITTGGSVVVAVIDTGVNYNHEDLASNMWVNDGEIPSNQVDDDGNGYVDDYRGWDFYNQDNDPMDDHNHGTHCSGTIGAVGNDSTGIPGVNWTVKIMPLKFLDQCGSGSTSGAIEAILYAKNMGAKIASNSWGGGGYSESLYEAIQDFGDEGGLFVAAAGNDGTDNDETPSYPASYDLPNIIAVAATDRNDALAEFSNYGVTSVDVAAPGVAIYSTVIDGYDTFSGTSMATPHVSGVAALLKSQNTSWTYAPIKTAIESTVDPKTSLAGKVATGGRINAYEALRSSLIPESESAHGGDFNGDGKGDILWRHDSTGEVYIWLMNGTSIGSQGSSGTVSDLNWKIQKVGDYTGDGKADILWRHNTTGELSVWVMDGITRVSGGTPGWVTTDWQIRDVGDFDGDGKADFLWRNVNSGQVYIWLMNGTSIGSQGSSGTVSDPNWKIRGSGDLGGDGKSDMVWRHYSTGEVSIWVMDGVNRFGGGTPGYVSMDWRIK